MNELKMLCMKSNAIDQPLRRFRHVVLSIADDRVADRRKLRSDLILQSRDQRHSDERSTRKKAFDGILEFSARRFRVSLRAQPLKHSLPSKIVNERPFLGAETAAKHREILPHGSMAEKLYNERISIQLGFRKEQHPGREPIDAMDDKSSLSLQLESCGKQRQSGRSIGAFNRHRRKSGRLIEDHHSIVFVKHG